MMNNVLFSLIVFYEMQSGLIMPLEHRARMVVTCSSCLGPLVGVV